MQTAHPLRLDALTAADVQVALAWRNTDAVRLGLRTPYMLTAEMQDVFYRDTVCNRNANARWWAVRDTEWIGRRDVDANWQGMMGMAGLESIQWENGLAEISLLVDPAWRGHGIGGQAVALVLCEAFERMRLMSVIAETYANNPAVGFWNRMAERYGGIQTTLPHRKFWEGRLYDSQIVTFTTEEWNMRERECAA